LTDQAYYLLSVLLGNVELSKMRKVQSGKGSPNLESYVETLSRVSSAAAADAQAASAKTGKFRASLVLEPLPEQDDLSAVFTYHRHRTGLLD
jgi:hypothetical protein